jgi:hypothetical protein
MEAEQQRCQSCWSKHGGFAVVNGCRQENTIQKEGTSLDGNQEESDIEAGDWASSSSRLARVRPGRRARGVDGRETMERYLQNI